MLKPRTWSLAGAALLAGTVAFVLFDGDSPSPTSSAIESKRDHARPAPKISPPHSSAERPEVRTEPGTAAADAPVDDAPGSEAAFRIDRAGELIVDEQTRLNIEALIAQNESRELHAAVRDQSDDLPPAAARQAEELVDKFLLYQQAQRQIDPPDNAPLTEDDAVRQLETLHALREAHFGPEIARRFFGREEAIGREMIEVLRVENDQSLTPQEKLERGQALREQLPGVAAIERSNRESAEAQERQENH